MTRAALLAELRKVIDDESTRPKWEDPILLAYMAEGQDVFCEETGFFSDVSTYTLTTTAGLAIYDISDRIIEVKSIWWGTNRLGHIQEEDKTNTERRSEVFDVSGSYPYWWQADQETGLITIYPTPTESDLVFQLRVWRYPLFALDSDDVDGEGTPAEPELHPTLQRACVEYAAFKALEFHDTEMSDRKSSADHLDSFNWYVSRGRRALRRRQSNETAIKLSPAYAPRG
jgi:hypothetical protein